MTPKLEQVKDFFKNAKDAITYSFVFVLIFHFLLQGTAIAY